MTHCWKEEEEEAEEADDTGEEWGEQGGEAGRLDQWRMLESEFSGEELDQVEVLSVTCDQEQGRVPCSEHCPEQRWPSSSRADLVLIDCDQQQTLSCVQWRDLDQW